MERQLIADWLEKNDKTQVWLAERTGIQQNHISEFLAGKKALGWDNVVAICRETSIDLNALAGLKKASDTKLKVVPDGIQIGEVGVPIGRIKIRINGYIDAEIVNS